MEDVRSRMKDKRCRIFRIVVNDQNLAGLGTFGCGGRLVRDLRGLGTVLVVNKGWVKGGDVCVMVVQQIRLVCVEVSRNHH